MRAAMTGATNHQPYGNPGRAQSPWGPGPSWNGNEPDSGLVQWWRTLPKPVRIALVVVGFFLWWPVGLFLLLFSLWGGRMSCWNNYRTGGYQGGPPPWAGWRSFWCGGGGGSSDRPHPTSGNRAFDEYRTETLRRLEDEQKEFSEFLERLRVAKDKAEFDQFMADRRARPPAPPEPPPA
jgi:hypothetical protein